MFKLCLKKIKLSKSLTIRVIQPLRVINYRLKNSIQNLIATIIKKIPNNLFIFFLSIRCTVFAPTLAINVVIGIKIKKAGMLIKPILNGKFVFK